MKTKLISQYLKQRLAETEGEHAIIAREAGVAQATISRIYLGLCSPRLDTAEALVACFERRDKRDARKARRLAVKAVADAAAVTQPAPAATADQAPQQLATTA